MTPAELAGLLQYLTYVQDVENETEYYWFCRWCDKMNFKQTIDYQLSKEVWQVLLFDLGFNITALAAFGVRIGDYMFVFAKGTCRVSLHWDAEAMDTREGEHGPEGVLMFAYDLRNGFEDCRALKAKVIPRSYGGKQGIEALTMRYGFSLVPSDIIPAKFVREYTNGEKETVACKYDPDTRLFFDIPAADQTEVLNCWGLLPPFDEFSYPIHQTYGTLFVFNQYENST